MILTMLFVVIGLKIGNPERGSWAILISAKIAHPAWG